MGFFNKMFSGQKDRPPLDAASPAAQRLAAMNSELEELARQANDNLEVVPGAQRSWVFIGKPPKRFGLAWIEGKQVRNLKSFADEKGIAPARMTRIVEEIREAYVASESDPRFDAEVAGKRVLVAPSKRLEQKVDEIIQSAET
ncbi:MAG TPA: hypothetical protein VK997_13095 [Deferrisomatales bacterium]|nr:hypothetical protein [Deferrisomatales bacterium]